MKQVLVAGGTGFLGGLVVARLRADGHHVTSHGRTRGDVAGDLADAATADRLIGERTWDVIVNLAGPVTSGDEDLPRGIDVVAEHARIALQVRRLARGARVIHASSMTVYGLPDRVEVDEATTRRPRHLYGLAKMLAEDVLLSAHELDAWILRLPGLFSEHRNAGALYHFARAANRGEPVKVTATTPTPWNILHVEDAAEAIVRAVMSPARAVGAINVSHDEPIELVQIARRIATLAGRGSAVEQVAGVAHPSVQLMTNRLVSVLGWKPPSLEQRLVRLVRFHAAP